MQITNHYIYTRKRSPFYYCRFSLDNYSYLVKCSKIKVPVPDASTKEISDALKAAGDFAYRFSKAYNDGVREREEKERYIQSSVTLRDYAKDFFSLNGNYIAKRKTFKPGINDRWIIEKQSMVNNHIIPSPIAEKYLRDITADDIELFVMKLKPLHAEKPLSANTKNKILMLIKIILKEACRNGLIDRIPIIDLSFEIDEKEKGALTENEVKLLFPERWERIWPDRRAYVGALIAAHLSRRLGELLAIQVKHIDFDNKALIIKQAYDGRLHVINPTPKNKKTRTVALCDKVLAEIRLYIEETGITSESLLFAGDKEGLPVDKKYFPRHFRNALHLVGINTEGRSIVWHSLRHTANTLLLEAGINFFKVAAFMGHTRRQDMTARYSHTGLNDQSDIRMYFERILYAKNNIITLKQA
jgi:integrase